MARGPSTSTWRSCARSSGRPELIQTVRGVGYRILESRAPGTRDLPSGAPPARDRRRRARRDLPLAARRRVPRAPVARAQRVRAAFERQVALLAHEDVHPRAGTVRPVPRHTGRAPVRAPEESRPVAAPGRPTGRITISGREYLYATTATAGRVRRAPAHRELRRARASRSGSPSRPPAPSAVPLAADRRGAARAEHRAPGPPGRRVRVSRSGARGTTRTRSRSPARASSVDLPSRSTRWPTSSRVPAAPSVRSSCR